MNLAHLLILRRHHGCHLLTIALHHPSQAHLVLVILTHHHEAIHICDYLLVTQLV